MQEIKTVIQLRNDTAENWNTDAGQATPLKPGEVAVEIVDGKAKLKIGTNEGSTFGNSEYFGAEPVQVYANNEAILYNDERTDAAIIAELVGENELHNGDCAIVKRQIAEGSGSNTYTSYVYDDGKWVAMDGNYDASNVYFKDDITLAGNYDKVGNIKLSDGTLEASGKSLAELMQTIFTQELYPNNSDIPEISLTASGNSGEVGSSYTLPTATLKLTDVGSYAYGPATGITVAIGDASITQGGETAKNTSVMTKDSTITLKATDTETLYTDTSKSYTFNASLKYSDGAVPVTNLGNEYESAQIKSDTLTASKTATFSGYRKAFAGGTSAATINSEVVRSMSATKTSKSSMDSQGEALEFTAAAGTTKVFFAYPNSWTGTPYFEMFGLAWAENSNIVAKNNIDVADARGTVEGVLQGATSYKLYCWELDTPLQAETTKFRVWFK